MSVGDVLYIIMIFVTFFILSGLLSIKVEKDFGKLDKEDLFMCGFFAVIPSLIWPFVPLIAIIMVLVYYGTKYSNKRIKNLLKNIKP